MGVDDRTEASLARLGARYGLGPRKLEQLGGLLEVLNGDEWAPTTVRNPGQAVEVHVADSLVALEWEIVRSAATLADLGAGAGFPGLPLAIALAACEVRLVESQTRKCVFLRGVLDRLGVDNAHVVHARVEEWRDGMGQHDVVTARAVAAQPVVLEYAAPLLRLGGTLMDWRGRRIREEEDTALRAAEELGLRRVEVRRVDPFEEARDHHLHVYLKDRDTPDRFPRRPGMARKRPLAA